MEPKTIGEHLKRRRIELGLKQVEVASLLGVHRGSIQLWERNIGKPGVKCFPAIIRFLKYIPFECDGTSAGRLSFLRHCCGKTQEDLADIAGCNVTSIWRWERGLINDSKKLDNAIDEVWAELGRLEIGQLAANAFGEI